MQWLITGCSSGLGLELARVVLSEPGQKVIATSRNPASSPEAVKEVSSAENGSWATLDVSAADAEVQLDKIVAEHGPIDVLINNAGYAIGGAVENTPMEAIRRLYETNVFGPIRLAKAITPSMREGGKGGTIVNISSAEFWEPHPGATVYASSKFALDGVSEALASELAAFKIRVLTVQPGGIRTSLLDPGKASSVLTPLPDAYKGTMVDYVLQAIQSTHGSQSLDPQKTARAIVTEVLTPTLVRDRVSDESRQLLRLQLGKECISSMAAKLQRFQQESDLVKDRALACDFAS